MPNAKSILILVDYHETSTKYIAQSNAQSQSIVYRSIRLYVSTDTSTPSTEPF
jgi:hypothetical protein